MNGNIDTLRNEILNFASTVSLSGGRKYVILDEADYLNANSTQPALRNFMEEFSRNCGYILTANFANRIIEPLHSRCTVIEFKIPKKEIPKLAVSFFKRVQTILSAEGVEYDKAAVAEVINKHFPDCRRILNELQRYSATGKIDSGILAALKDISITELLENVKDKNFTEVRKWVAENLDSNINEIFRKIYDSSIEHVKPQYIPALVVLIGKYQYQAAFCADQEINLASFFAEVMMEGIYNA
jgi:DNA polymerase III delta prime subunit